MTITGEMAETVAARKCLAESSWKFASGFVENEQTKNDYVGPETDRHHLVTGAAQRKTRPIGDNTVMLVTAAR